LADSTLVGHQVNKKFTNTLILNVSFHTVCRCAQSPRFNVLALYTSARRFFARLASGSF
jgi:hypothetical protein